MNKNEKLLLHLASKAPTMGQALDILTDMMQEVVDRQPSSILVIEDGLMNTTFDEMAIGFLAGFVLENKFSQHALKLLLEDGIRCSSVSALS